MPLFNPLLEQDLQHILNHNSDLWDNFKNKTIFITGGTGFFGKWLLESFSFANFRLQLDAEVVVLSRDPDAFLGHYPYFKQSAIRFVKGDVRNFEFPVGKVDYIIHAATEASDKLNTEQPLLMFDTIVEGTRHVLDLAKEKNVRSFLMTSSGAVYGKQPSDLTHIPEDYSGVPIPGAPKSAYAEGKLEAEKLCSLYHNKYQIPIKIARCFAFVGPYLPLDTHFAIGNFIRNVLDGKNIIIKGDGTPYRSYLYASDLMIWLWTILIAGKNNIPYNVGSQEDVTIEQLGAIVAQCAERDIRVQVAQKKDIIRMPERYVPDVRKAGTQLSLRQTVHLKEAIKKTLAFERGKYV
jgi:nucleoside-diphosphate-sugar epimerase